MKTKDFEYEITNDEVIITNYIGNETDVVIPSKIEEYPVTNIGSYAFGGCSSLTSVRIPNSVTIIGKRAFAWCSSLTSISIPNSVTIVGRGAFYDCSSLIDITIPNSVTIIGRGAFGDCSSLTSVTIPNGITIIEDSAFEGCGLYSKASNYKAFNLKNSKLICMNNCEFKENKWSDNIDNLELGRRGYHYCTNLFEIFDHYCGVIDEDIVIYECEVGDVVVKSETSKCVTNRIKPVKRLSREDIIKILNGIK